MAKGEAGGKDAGKGSEYEFVPPDFDEDAFIHREVVGFRTTVLLFLWGIVVALGTYVIFAFMGSGQTAWLLSLALMAVAGFAMKWLLPALKADVRHFGRKEWFGTGALYFFTWLAFAILLVNPPVGDFAPPRLDGYAQPSVQQAGGEVTFSLVAADNGAVQDVRFSLRQGTEVVATEEHLQRKQSGIYTYTLPADRRAGTYTWEATAVDAKGHTATARGSFRVTSQALDFQRNNITLDATNRVTVTVLAEDGQPLLPACTPALVRSGSECIRSVRLEHVGGGDPVFMRYDAASGRWMADDSFRNWKQGRNEVRVVADVIDRWDGVRHIDGGELVLPGPFIVHVPQPTGTTKVDVPAEPDRPQRDVPGFGLPALLAVIAVAAVILRRRA
ncbi:MAG TPA: Loki-CTERM sorting domain-containing protein [Candidatus Thermoplasmatota archaeon]|nr:Loki-CTERM sorting domain-containing protein [Candidatus Thermoplasmatota archaeon]